MSRLRPRIDALWPAALLVLFLATFRTTGRESVYDQASPDCDATRSSDIGTLERCLAIDSRNVELMTDIGDHYRQSGRSDRAEALYRRALAIDPHDGDVHLRLGELLLSRGDAAAARTEGEAALASQPGSLAAERLVERAGAGLQPFESLRVAPSNVEGRRAHDAPSPSTGAKRHR